MSYTGFAYQVREWMSEKIEQARRDKKPEPCFDVKVHKKKRSLDQNAYYWELLGKLAYKLGYANDEVHRHMLREYGTYDVFTVREGVPISAYFRYYDLVGEGCIDGVRYLHVRAFKGSSEMDTAEFSKLLNGLIQECEQQGIDTMTPEEAARLKWVESSAA